jgi:single-strand DNA-binding protein
MNETRITVHGNVVAEPVERPTRTGGVFTTFRIATTPFRRTGDGRYVDGETSFYSVIAFNALGANAASSLRKGQPVVVAGKLSIREWQGADGRPRVSAEIDAEHVGHDLTYGRTSFERLSRAAALGQDRLADPEVRHSMRALADDADPGDVPAVERDERSVEVFQLSDERPPGVDENGVVHDLDTDPATEIGRTTAAPHPDDAETDDYDVVDPLSA